MNHYYENGVLTICMDGRIDSNNALTMEKEVMDVITEHPGASLVLDGETLEYISSAGLRVLMKLQKQSKKALPVINVSTEVYDIFEVTGFTDILDVKKRLREISIEGCEKAGDLFFMKYTGITDSAALSEYYKKLELLCAVSLALVPGGGSEWAMKNAPVMMDTHLRSVVIPNVAMIRNLYKTL